MSAKEMLLCIQSDKKNNKFTTKLAKQIFFVLFYDNMFHVEM